MVLAHLRIPASRLLGLCDCVGSLLARQTELTSLRGVAALWVFVYHIPIYLGFASLDTPIISSGYLGVPIFFILSIYLLLKSLDSNPSLEHYFVRRVKRIWPMYFVTIALVFVYYSHSLSWLAEQTTFGGVFIDNESIGYVFWSLQIEEVAYLFFPAIHRLSNSSKMSLAIGLYGASVVSFFLILRFGFALSLWWVPLSLASYGLGIMVYLKRIPRFTLALLIVAPFYWDAIPFEMAAVFIAPGFAWVVQESYRIKLLKSKGLVWVGNNSYGLYLLHPILLAAFGVVGIVLALPLAWAFERANALGMERLKHSGAG